MTSTTGPFGGTRDTLARRLPEVETVEDAAKHFSAEHETAMETLPMATHVENVSAYQAMTIDLAKLGSAPGNTYVYLFSKVGITLLFEPTHYFRYAWGELKFLDTLS